MIRFRVLYLPSLFICVRAWFSFFLSWHRLFFIIAMVRLHACRYIRCHLMYCAFHYIAPCRPRRDLLMATTRCALIDHSVTSNDFYLCAIVPLMVCCRSSQHSVWCRRLKVGLVWHFLFAGSAFSRGCY